VPWRWTVRILLIVATVLTVATIFAVWANRQALNPDNWATTSTRIIADQRVRTRVSEFAVDQLYSNVDVTGALRSALPAQLDRLAGPIGSGLRDPAQRAAFEALGRPAVQEAWRRANRAAAAAFVRVAEGKSATVTTSGTTVYLNLQAVLKDVAQRIGLSGNLIARLPPNVGRVRVATDSQLPVIQKGVRILHGLAVVLPLVAAACFAAAVALARGRRRRTLMAVGWGLLAAGVLVLVLRSIVGDRVVTSLASTESSQPAVAAVWSIGTGMMQSIAQTTACLGLVVVVAAWLGGPMAVARWLRRLVSPWLRDEPVVVYGVVAAGLLGVIAWDPIPATHMVIPMALIAVLVVVGVEALRRETAREFPSTTPGDSWAMVRGGWDRMRGALPGGSRGRAPAPLAAPAPSTGLNVSPDDSGSPVLATSAGPTPTALAATAEQSARLHVLERLVALHDRGALDDAQFAAEKDALLVGHGAGAGPGDGAGHEAGAGPGDGADRSEGPGPGDGAGDGPQPARTR